jgi:hypothetical protein
VERSSLNSNTLDEREQLEIRLAQVREDIRDTIEKEDREAEAATFFTVDGVRERFKRRREPLEAERSELSSRIEGLSVSKRTSELSKDHEKSIDEARSRFDKGRSELLKRRERLSERLQAAARKTSSSLKPALAALEKHRNSITKKYNRQSDQAKLRFDEKMSELKIKETKINNHADALSKLKNKLQEQRKTITKEAQNNQVYRVARWFYDKDSAADLTQKQINRTTFFWFGSLAAITAWTGTLLAFGGLVTKYEHGRHDFPNRPLSSYAKLINSLRRYLVFRRKRAREPEIKIVENEVIRTVEVIKEVPVDKVVFKEVPVEVIKKEIVYVPLMTDEEDLVRKSNAAE